MNAGDHYGRYEIVRLIGRGAMGDVYLARDTEAGRQVALKIVYKGPEPDDQEILDAERVGAELQKRLSAVDSRVTSVNRYGDIAGDLFIEMEYVEGEDLSMLLARGPLQTGFAVHVATELCDMLENLRAFATSIGGRQFAGVVHGDLKPRNIRISGSNHVKVVDFGIAKALSETRKFTTNVFASTAYSSPERLETQCIDTHSDLWALGVLLYQMIAGRLPFDETSKERLERRIRYSPPDPLPDSCPEPLVRIIMKTLARNTEYRYQTPADLKADLLRFRAGEPVVAQAYSESEATVRTTAPVEQPSGETFDEDRTVRTAPVAEDRTTRTAAPGPSRPVAPSVSAQLRRQVRPTMGCFAAIGIAVMLFAGWVWWQMDFSNKASRLKTDLQAEKVSNLDDAWTRYEQLASRSHLPFLLWGAKGAMKDRLITAADAVIRQYRDNDAPTVYQAQWEQARKQLLRALEVDSDDKAVRGRLRLCEGHLERINAGRQKGAERQKMLNEAVADFEDAAQLLKKSPDPYLGLARLYVYDLNDVERAEQALKKAEDYGHPMGRRDIAQLADGYRRRGDRFWRESRGLAELPDQERGYLEKARDDYIHAQQLYEKAGLFGDATRNQVAAIQGQQRIEERLAELKGGVPAQ